MTVTGDDADRDSLLQIIHHIPSNARLRLTHSNGEVENIVIHRDGRIDRWFDDKPA